MSIYFGNDTVNDLYIGLTPVTKGYVGTHLFYNGDNTIIDLTYEKYILNTQYSTLYNTAEKPVKSAILKGNTGYRDIDTGEFLETFEEGRNLELVSVKMPVLTTTGKNLFDEINGSFKEKNSINTKTGEITYFPSHFGVFQNYIPVKPNTTYTLSGQLTDGNNPVFRIAFYQKDKAFNETVNKYVANNGVSNRTSYKFTTSENDHYIRFSFGVMMQGYFQLEEGSTATEYEPYKSNILTVNEPVELRGIDDVQDTLDCLTGEVTERIGEVVLDGSENWSKYGGYNLDGYMSFTASMPSLNNLYKKGTSFISADFTMASWTYYVNNKGVEVVWNHDHNKIGIRVKSEKASNVTEIKEFLSTNNIRISYKLATESIKTVDLSVVDQDGNNTELKTFNDITHVTLSSEGIIPEAELEVATKNEEVLNTLSLEMDDISTTQTTLEETSDTQSENVDTTMVATTEIYEQLL